MDTWLISANLSPASTATDVSDLQTVVNCRFRGSEIQRMEAVLLDMSVHLLGALFRTVLNAAHTLCLSLDAISNTFTSRFGERIRGYLQLTRYINNTYLLTYLCF